MFLVSRVVLAFRAQGANLCICIWFLAETHWPQVSFLMFPCIAKIVLYFYACFNIYRWMLNARVSSFWGWVFFVSSGLYQTGRNSQNQISVLCPPSVWITYSPEGLRMLLRFLWWFLNSFLVEYMNIVLPNQVFYCCKAGYWNPYFFISSFNSWWYFVFWKLFLNPAGILEGKKKLQHLSFFLFQFKGNIKGK